MAENNGKNRYTNALLISLLLLLAAVFFLLVLLLAGQDTPYRPAAKDIGYIDAGQIYDANENYRITKNEIEEYAARINSELQRALSHERDAKKREQLKREARRDIEIYSESLLQDIDSDIENAIDSIADEKNLKRVYLKNRSKKNIQNLTDDVITELDRTTAQRIAMYLENRLPGEKRRQKEQRIAEQYNFEAYPVANAPEQGIAPHQARKMHGKDSGTVVADTVVRNGPKFPWREITGCKLPLTGRGYAPKAQVNASQVNNIQQPAAMELVTERANSQQPTAKFNIPTDKTPYIASSFAYAGNQLVSFIAARNAQMQLSAVNCQLPVVSCQQPTAQSANEPFRQQPAARGLATERANSQQPTAKFNIPTDKTPYIASAFAYACGQIPCCIASFSSKAAELYAAAVQKAADYKTQREKEAKAAKEAKALKEAEERKTAAIPETEAPKPPSVALASVAANSSSSASVAENSSLPSSVAENSFPSGGQTANAVKPLDSASARRMTNSNPRLSAGEVRAAQKPEALAGVTNNGTTEQRPTTDEQRTATDDRRPTTDEQRPMTDETRRQPTVKITIQFAASGSRQGINAVVAKAQRAGIAAYAAAGPVKEDGTQIWRARATAQGAEQAKSYMQKLRSLGHESFIVRR